MFDAATRLIATVDPLANTSSLGYDAQPVDESDRSIREYLYGEL